MFWIIFIGIIVVSMGLAYEVRRRDVGGKAAARDVGRAAVIFGVIAVIWIGFYRRFPGFWEDHAWGSLFQLFIVVFIWAGIATWSWRKRQAGAVLLDLGRSKSHKMNLVGGCLVAGLNMLVLVGGLLGMEGELGVEDVSRYLFWISFGLYMLLVGLSHSEIREYGILHLSRFLNWKKIESYKWEGKDGLTLTVRVKQRLPFRRLSLGTPSVHKDTVNSLVAEHVSGAATEGTNGT